MAAPMSWTLDIVSSVPAPRLFFAGVMDWHTLAPKLTPDIVASGEVIVGDGKVSSVRQLNFTKGTRIVLNSTYRMSQTEAHIHDEYGIPADMPFSCMKERLDFVDVEKFESKSTLIEGAGIDVWIKTATTDIKIVPSTDGGCVVKVEWTCELLPGVEMKDEQLKLAKDSLAGIFKAAEAYLIANPDKYN
jgi:hypothetical protein